MWSAKRVIESQPPWLRHFYRCEKAPRSIDALRQLRASHPKRDIQIFEGDFNNAIAHILPAIPQKEATFCLLDQRTFQCSCETVQQIAASKSGMKIEQFYFLANAWFDRAIQAARPEILRRWWGRGDWNELRRGTAHERAAVVADRFRHELNYASAKPWPIFQRPGSGGRVMYFMIHATDHPEAPRLIARAYRKSVKPAEQGEQATLELL